jgi:predicted ATP-grasp superfamily ATP-dependent carboligase
VDNFTRLSIDQINVSIDDIAKEFEAYKAQLVEIMKSLKSSAPRVNQQNAPHPPIIGPQPGLD